jgi:hypothetical protein
MQRYFMGHAKVSSVYRCRERGWTGEQIIIRDLGSILPTFTCIARCDFGWNDLKSSLSAKKRSVVEKCVYLFYRSTFELNQVR